MSNPIGARMMMGVLVSLLAALAAWFPAPARARGPAPDPAPQAHHRKATILPACPPLHLKHRGYVVEAVNGRVVCAGAQG